MKIEICRVYEPPMKKIGIWILVDRLWPRGLKKETIPFDLWLKEISPSPQLRKWFSHDPDKWIDFANKYAEELKNKPELLKDLLKKSEQAQITLFYAAKDKKHNHAKVLLRVLQTWPKEPKFEDNF